MTTETTFEFDLVFALPADSADEATILDALFEAGCDDAVVGLGAGGMIGLAFVRHGTDARAVIETAIRQAKAALPNEARLREVKPDLVSLADVAARLNVTRQALQKREMPPPSLAGLYRVTEIRPYLERQSGKVAGALTAARAWFAAAPAAQAINAELSHPADRNSTQRQAMRTRSRRFGPRLRRRVPLAS
ncbi:MAG: hypothetical protein ACOCYW_07625 [Roseicyclus sp.]